MHSSSPPKPIAVSYELTINLHWAIIVYLMRVFTASDASILFSLFLSLLSCERCFHEQRLLKFDLYTKLNIDRVQLNTNYTRAELQLLTSVTHFIYNAQFQSHPQRVFSDDATIQLLNLKILGKERNPWLNNKLFEKNTQNLWTKREQLLDCLFSWQLMKILLQFSLWNLLSW